MRELEHIYTVLAGDQNNPISLNDYLKWTDNARARAFFQSVLNIDIYKAEQSFKLLDLNEDGLIDREEFVAGCMRLAGKMNNMENAMNVRFLKKMRKELLEVCQDMRQVKKQLDVIITRGPSEYCL